jgi:hypothetical protein
MKHFSFLGAVIAFLLALLVASCEKEPTATEPLAVAPPTGSAVTLGKNQLASWSVFYSGLLNPRGLKFGPDGYLYVAEGGSASPNPSVGACDQVIAPVGPYTWGMTSRISKISPNGTRTTVVDNLPSSQTQPIPTPLVSGVADIAFIGNTLYAVYAGAGCSHGFPNTPNQIVRVNSDGSLTEIADLSAYQQAHPVAHPEPDDFEPDGTWYSLINVRGDLYAVEPNHGEMVKVTTSGQVSRVIDFSASYGHIVPTAMAYNGNFFVGNLNPFPVVPGSSSIYKVNPGGQSQVWATGFTTILGVAIDQQRRIYVLENSSVAGNGPTPGTGQIVRLSNSGQKDVIVTGLTLPTGMTFGPDGKLYVSNIGFGPPAAGGGQIVRVDLQ